MSQDNYKIIYEQLKKCGKDVVIYPWAKIIKPEVVEIDDHSRIDDFVFIYGGNGVKIGKYVHIASFVSVIGGGCLELGDYSAIACGSRLITGTNVSKGGLHMSAASPKEEQNIIQGKIIVEKDGFVGTNVVIHPNLKIGEGAVIGSNSLVLENILPWTINVGSPCRIIGYRENIKV